MHDETVARLDQLVAHFGIDPASPDRLAILAIGLAKEFVKNFNVYSVKRRGRPRGRKIPNGLELAVSVGAIVQKRGLGIADACRTLALVTMLARSPDREIDGTGHLRRHRLHNGYRPAARRRGPS